MSAKILINATVNAVNSDSFSLLPNKAISLTCSGLISGEEIKVQIWHEANYGGADYIDYIINGAVQKFDMSNVVLEIWDSSLIYRIVKPVTTNNVGVAINII